MKTQPSPSFSWQPQVLLHKEEQCCAKTPTAIAVCGKYNFHARIQLQIYLGWIFWQMQIQIYLGWQNCENINMNIFWSHVWDDYKYKHIRVYQEWVNMNTNTIIWTDIRKYEYKYKYYHTLNKNKMFMDIKDIKYAIIYNLWFSRKLFVQIRIQIYLGWKKTQINQWIY